MSAKAIIGVIGFLAVFISSAGMALAQEQEIDLEVAEDAVSFLSEWEDFANGCSNELTTAENRTAKLTVINECMAVMKAFNQKMNEMESQHGTTIEKYADEAPYTDVLGLGSLQ